MLQQYVPPAGEQPAEWVNTPTRCVELKPRRDGQESDPVTAYCVRHMRARQRKGEPQFRMMVHEYLGRAFVSAFVVHIDGTRTAIGD
ncbi:MULTISPECIES: hypothetical protein [unclassified Streptomyces]|uniref:hypothetical protein n=1 Tax=unclassified Streptomyces TaxID=2593676 RepID=UPI00224FFB3D|nr:MULTISPECIES: hypothetical protein [unclassified Streptomyces]MCX5189510.1 hypothetical protein [Streptomyces sp. NBC_00268]